MATEKDIRLMVKSHKKLKIPYKKFNYTFVKDKEDLPSCDLTLEDLCNILTKFSGYEFSAKITAKRPYHKSTILKNMKNE